MDIERLRALEKKWRDESVSGFDGDGNLSDTWTAQAMRSCADELATLIAELGQEVGAVAIKRDRPAQEPGGVECQACGCIFIGEEWHSVCGVCLHSTSPAHTSEARDALRNLVKTVHTVAFSGDYGIDDDAIEALADALDDANAAMRQEAGDD